MYLKKLDILGFKSFANKTTLHFSGGVTAVVGPNGCGKTNILDALRWVLGEQKVTLLRGSKMEEVIFNGSRDLKPLGMAEVTLSLVNNGRLPTEYHEVQITRRLFRSGESEYLLNKVPCRLKDIAELFYDTGMGAHSYSVIQSDMIDAVISDKAEERRFLFEEAAGITKYKQRKRAALRKLEATENDFLRLNDIYSEVKTQVNSLRRQYKKAERYQAVRDDIKAWELFLGSDRVKTLETEKRQVKAEADALADRAESQKAELDVVSAQLEADRREQLDLEHELNQIGGRIFDISEKAHQLENEISVLREKRANSRELIERDSDDIKALNARAQILAEQIADAQKELEDRQTQLTSLAEQSTVAETAQAAADGHLLSARLDKENENRRLLELEGRLSSGKTEESGLHQQEEELQAQLNELKQQVETNLALQASVGEEAGHTRGALERATAKKNDAEKLSTDLNSELEKLVERGEELTLEISNLTASLEACLARRHLLEDMMLHYEGHDSGVVAAMEIKQRWPGLGGTVAERFVPVEGLEIAVEAALGELARFVICDDRVTAESIIAFLKAEKKGRIGILVPDSGTLNPGVKRPEIGLPEFVGWLDSLVTTDDKLRPLMQAVLSRVAVFRQGYDPAALLERLPYGFKAVSTDGLVYGKNVIAGGSEDQFPLFRRREKVGEQDKIAADLSVKLEELRSEKNRNTARIASVRAESARVVSLLETLGEEIGTVTEKLNESGYRLKALESEMTRLERERQNAAEKLERIRHRQYTLSLDYTQLAGQKESLVSYMSQAGVKLGDLETAAAEAVEKVAAVQVKTVEARSRVEQSDTKIAHLEELGGEISNTLLAKQTEIEQAEQTILSAADRIAVMEEGLKEAFEQRTDMTTRQSRLRLSQTDLLERVTDREKRLKTIRAEKEATSQEMHQLEIRLMTLESEAATVADKMREEYDVDIRAAQPPRPDESLLREQALERLQQRKELLKKFGAVNLLALEEYKTTSDREKFLGEQLADLTGAKRDLQETIGKINHTARELFTGTFSQVKQNFQRLFVELFSGGEADLALVDPDDPLESDIEITARPRGKRLLNITMMSGGERALTAISLLFSLYMVKPSPFCILDEIDAPLDDANCRRFLKIIHSFSNQTQFIVITHNKITMEAANNLYGITMEQPGISKVVGVRLSEAALVEPTTAEPATAEAASEPMPASTSSTSGHDSITPGNGDESDPIPPAVARRLSSEMALPVPDEDQS